MKSLHFPQRRSQECYNRGMGKNQSWVHKKVVKSIPDRLKDVTIYRRLHTPYSKNLEVWEIRFYLQFRDCIIFTVRIELFFYAFCQYSFLISFFGVDKKNQLDVTFCILYFSSNSCSTCFGQPCAHHQELTTAWCYSLVLACAVAAGRLLSPVGR